MPKLEPVTNEAGEVIGYVFRCLGCGEIHQVAVQPHENENGESWTFNGDLEKPTFNPSIVNRWESQPSTTKLPKRCHLYIVNGNILYLFDCTHDKAGEVVEIPEIEM